MCGDGVGKRLNCHSNNDGTTTFKAQAGILLKSIIRLSNKWVLMIDGGCSGVCVWKRRYRCSSHRIWQIRFCLDKSAFRTADSTNELFPCNFFNFFWLDKQFGGKRHKEHWNTITAPKSRQSLALKCDVNIINTSAQDGGVKNNSP